MEKFVQERLEICSRCKNSRQTEFGMKCDDRKYVNKDGTDSSFFKKDGYVRGCGCLLSHRAANINSHCIINLW